MILQLNPPLPMRHVTKGYCLAHFLIDYGIESDLYFTCLMHFSGEIWTFNSKELRADKNYTIGRITTHE